MQTRSFKTASGRKVAFHIHNLAGRHTVVFCHPAPGSGQYSPELALLQDMDVQLIGVDRPGYGQSDPVASGDWATVGGAADDIAEMLRMEGISAMGALGWSAGGRVALALAARHPDLVQHVAVVATPAPNEAVKWVPEEISLGIQAMKGMSSEQVHAAMAFQFSEGFDPSNPEMALGMLGASEADQAILSRPEAKKALEHMLHMAFEQGFQGMVADIAGYMMQPWGFSPEQVQVPVQLFYGTSDPIIGLLHAEWWQKSLPNAETHEVSGAGHLLMADLWPSVLRFLTPLTRAGIRSGMAS